MSAPVTTPTAVRSAPAPVRLPTTVAHLAAALALLVADSDDLDGVVTAVLGRVGPAAASPEAEALVRTLVATVSRPPSDAGAAAVLAAAGRRVVGEAWADLVTRLGAVEAAVALAGWHRRTLQLVAAATGASLAELQDVCTALLAPPLRPVDAGGADHRPRWARGA